MSERVEKGLTLCPLLGIFVKLGAVIPGICNSNVSVVCYCEALRAVEWLDWRAYVREERALGVKHLKKIHNFRDVDVKIGLVV